MNLRKYLKKNIIIFCGITNLFFCLQCSNNGAKPDVVKIFKEYEFYAKEINCYDSIKQDLVLAVKIGIEDTSSIAVLKEIIDTKIQYFSIRNKMNSLHKGCDSLSLKFEEGCELSEKLNRLIRDLTVEEESVERLRILVLDIVNPHEFTEVKNDFVKSKEFVIDKINTKKIEMEKLEKQFNEIKAEFFNNN